MIQYRRLVQSGAFLEVYEYQFCPSRHLGLLRKDKKKRLVRNRRPDNIRRLSACFKRLVWSNLDDSVPVLMTLTFRDDIDINKGYALFSVFRRKLDKISTEVRYIAVPEFGEKNTKRLHFHVLVWGISKEMVILERKTRFFANMWGNGFIDMRMTDGSPKLAGYLAKYLSKSLEDERLINKKAYSTSRNIKRPNYIKMSNLMWDYRDDMWDLSTACPLQSKTYKTEWLGKCYYNKYKI